MKKVVLIAIIALLGFVKVNGQNSNISVVAGYHNLTIKANGGGMSASADGNGFFLGLSTQFLLSEKLFLNPEIHFASSTNEGESAEQVILPIMLKHPISDEFSLLAGPQFDLVVSDSDGINAFGLGVGFGLSYHLSGKFFASTRYAIGLSNRLEDAPSGVNVKFNTFQAGIGYRF